MKNDLNHLWEREQRLSPELKRYLKKHLHQRADGLNERQRKLLARAQQAPLFDDEPSQEEVGGLGRQSDS